MRNLKELDLKKTEIDESKPQYSIYTLSIIFVLKKMLTWISLDDDTPVSFPGVFLFFQVF